MFSLRVLFSRSASSNLQFNLRAVSTSKMAANKRDLGNETEGDDCLKAYKYFYNPELLKGKVAFITGGGSGIGFRIAEIFMRHGCTTAIASRKFERVAEAAKKLTAATDVQCIPIKMDVRDSQQVEFGINSCVTKLKKIDILINCAAGNFLSPIDDLSYNAFKTVMDIDTLGTYNVSKAAYKYYLKNHGGNIINITATLHYRGCIMQCHAGSAKAAIDAMTKHMAVEWGGKTGIRVNALAPGPIAGTVGMNKLGGAMESMKDIIPVPRWGQKTEIAESALFLASDISSYVTGHVLVVDGGEWLVQQNFMPDMSKM